MAQVSLQARRFSSGGPEANRMATQNQYDNLHLQSFSDE